MPEPIDHAAEARAEAERRYQGMWHPDAPRARAAFVAGAAWQAAQQSETRETPDLMLNLRRSLEQARRQSETRITDEMVERVAHVLHEEFCLTRVYEGEGDEERIVGITPWDRISDQSRSRLRRTARAALVAALEGEQQ